MEVEHFNEGRISSSNEALEMAVAEDKAREKHPSIAQLEKKAAELNKRYAENIEASIEQGMRINMGDSEAAILYFIKNHQEDRAKKILRATAAQIASYSDEEIYEKYSNCSIAAELCAKYGDHEEARKYAMDQFQDLLVLKDTMATDRAKGQAGAEYFKAKNLGEEFSIWGEDLILEAEAQEILGSLDLAQKQWLEYFKLVDGADPLLERVNSIRASYGEGDFLEKIVHILRAKVKEQVFTTNRNDSNIRSILALCRIADDDKAYHDYLNGYVNPKGWVYPAAVKLDFAKELGLQDEEVKELALKSGQEYANSYRKDATLDRKSPFVQGYAEKSIEYFTQVGNQAKAREMLDEFIRDNKDDLSAMGSMLDNDKIAKLLTNEELTSWAAIFEGNNHLYAARICYRLAGKTDKASQMCERTAAEWESEGKLKWAAAANTDAAELLKHQ